jgi:hypothetical protein
LTAVCVAAAAAVAAAVAERVLMQEYEASKVAGLDVNMVSALAAVCGQWDVAVGA